MKALLARHFELSDSGPSRLRSMEGLRGVAILLVFLAHYYDIVWKDLPAQSATLSSVGTALIGIGSTGVDLFFILSGFLIYGAVTKKKLDFWRFLRRRAARIYPAFIPVFLLYLGMSLLIFRHSHGSARYDSRIPDTLGQAVPFIIANLIFIPGVFPVQPILNVAWSLSYEWTFYLLLPLVFWSFRVYRWPRTARLLSIATLSVGALVCAIWSPFIIYFPANIHHPSHIRAVMFLGGMLVFELTGSFGSGRFTGGFWNYATLLMAVLAAAGAAFAAVHWAGGSPNVMDVRRQALVTTGLLIGYSSWVSVALRESSLGQLLSADWLRWLGNMSYSFYLFHGLPLHVLGLLAVRARLSQFSQPLVWTLFAGGLPLSFLFTAVGCASLFLLVEKPWSLERRPSCTRISSTGGSLARPRS